MLGDVKFSRLVYQLGTVTCPPEHQRDDLRYVPAFAAETWLHDFGSLSREEIGRRDLRAFGNIVMKQIVPKGVHST